MLYTTGTPYSQVLALSKVTAVLEALQGLTVSSEQSPSMPLLAATQLASGLFQLTLPDNLVYDLDCLMLMNAATGKWQRSKDFKIVNNKLLLPEMLQGLAIGMPHSRFEDVVYSDGTHIYEMYLNRLDAVVYRDITISSNSSMHNPFISIDFALHETGPWGPEVYSAYLFEVFYMRVTVVGMTGLTAAIYVPTESICVQCTTCE